MSRYRLENCFNGFYHVWDGPVRIGVVLSNYDTWTARPCTDLDVKRQWAWVAPTRRQALAGLYAWLEERAA